MERKKTLINYLVIDTHAHIYLDDLKSDLPEIISRAKNVGVENILMPNIDVSTISHLENVVLDYKGYCIPMMGLHPCSVKENFLEELKVIENKLFQGSYVAVGEIGTDLYWDKSFWDQQKQVFLQQLKWAIELNLPVAIHCRDSLDITISMVEELIDSGLKGVFHCFTGNKAQAIRITEMGFYLGIGGIVTFKNAGLDSVLANTGLDKVILETDSPYLSPHPLRGKRNEPAYLEHIKSRVAEIMQSSEQEIIDKTSKNARELFDL